MLMFFQILSFTKVSIFFDSKVYQNSSPNFTGHMIHPTNYVYDYSSLKNSIRTYVKKPKFMSFKLSLDNQMLSFEKFYLKNKMFFADSIEYENYAVDVHKDFYYSSDTKRLRTAELYHFIRVRVPVEDRGSKDEF
jgi:hypothetical protein